MAMSAPFLNRHPSSAPTVGFRSGEKWLMLEVTSGGEACSSFTPDLIRGDYYLTFTWYDLAKPEIGSLELAGELVPQTLDPYFDRKAVTVDPSPPPMAAQPIKLDTDFKVRDYPVQIHGTVTPIVCK